MKTTSLLMLLLCVFGYQKQQAIAEKRTAKTEVMFIKVTRVAPKDTTSLIATMADKDTVILTKVLGKVLATVYFGGNECGTFTPNAEVRDGAVHISLNSTRCEGFNQAYYKVEALVNNPQNYTIVKDKYLTFLSPGDRLEHIRKKYNAGDINNDGIRDTVTAIYDQIVTADSTIYNDCGRGVCDLKLQFKKPVKPIVFEAMNVYVHPVMDVNGDSANEIAVYKWWYECCWVTLDLYSYKGNKWRVLATSKAFISWEDADFENRVVKEKSSYYLMGQQWNGDYSEVIPDKVKIKTK